MKGIVLGIGVLLLALVLFSMAFMLAESSGRKSRDIDRLHVFDRLDDELKATENAYRDIVGKAIIISRGNRTVFFNETLPSGDAASFTANVDNFRAFVGSHSQFAMKLDMSQVTSTLPLTIRPAGVRYDHPSGFGNGTIDITNAQAVLRYNVSILVNRSHNTPTKWKDGPNVDTNGIGFDITISHNGGTDFAYSNKLSTTLPSAIEIKLPGGNNEITITIGNASMPGMLHITNNDATIRAFVAVNMTVNTTDLISVNFPEKSINMTAPEYNISKLDAVRVD
ncbi:MAG: hypothetical protein HYY37_02780 [Candidatus Aenigmarchaeota archaeon]|nr:hypothetical protein [Candidatus Aenigmarchaeota archaeon]